MTSDTDAPVGVLPASGTLLLVDDSPTNLGVVADGLEALGYEVLVSKDGEEALRRAAIAGPDLILLDVMMPGMDGFEVCRRLKADERTRDVPVIFMTALDGATAKMEGFSAGGVDYITKPLDVNEVRARVATHLGLRALRRELEEKNLELRREVAERVGIEETLRENLSRISELNARLVDHAAALNARELESLALIENSPDTIARYDRRFRRIFVNRAFGNLVEGGADALLGTTPSDFPGRPYSLTCEKRLDEVFRSGEDAEFEVNWRDLDGNDTAHHVRLTAEYDESGAIASVLAVGRDISELHAYRRKLHRMAFYDPLTSLPNRALFGDRLQQMVNDASWHGGLAGVMVLDLDRFKVINDSLGHPTGDALLREAAVRLLACVRGYDTVARFGGDEFAILLPQVRSGEDLGGVARKIVEAFRGPFSLEGKELFASASIGIALYPDDSRDADDLVKHADAAMNFAKRSGRNGFRFYSKELTASANERLTIESDLRRAVERGELELHFQPKVELRGGTLVGSEALLRWRHPRRGLVPPDRFIHVAEDSGQIVEIGVWVLRDACRFARQWNGEGRPPHKVAVNLSSRQFQSGDLLATVRDALRETDCRPEWIELEITESLLLDEDGEVLETLNAFRAMGITIAIDDFGTGYSSLGYLARYPIDTLKIDRSFTGRMSEDRHHLELVKAMISIAQCLGQEVVAEGVESAEQAARLEAHGCRLAQGYFFGKPMGRVEFLEFAGGAESAVPATASR